MYLCIATTIKMKRNLKNRVTEEFKKLIHLLPSVTFVVAVRYSFTILKATTNENKFTRTDF